LVVFPLEHVSLDLTSFPIHKWTTCCYIRMWGVELFAELSKQFSTQTNLYLY